MFATAFFVLSTINFIHLVNYSFLYFAFHSHKCVFLFWFYSHACVVESTSRLSEVLEFSRSSTTLRINGWNEIRWKRTRKNAGKTAHRQITFTVTTIAE